MNYFHTGFLLFCILGFSFSASAAGSLPGGFVKSSLWVSKKPLYEKASVKIYTVVFNTSSGDLKGTAEFYVDGALIGATPFTVLGGGTQVVWSNWVAKVGQHTLSAKILDARISFSDGKEEAVVFDDSGAVSIQESVVPDPQYALRENDTRQAVSGVVAPVLGVAAGVLGTSSPIVSAGKGAADLLAVGYAATDSFVAGIHDALDREYQSVEGGGEASSTPLGTLEMSSGMVAGTSTKRIGAVEKETSAGATDPVTAVYLFVLATARFIFAHPWLLYFLIGAVVVLVLRMIFRRR